MTPFPLDSKENRGSNYYFSVSTTDFAQISTSSLKNNFNIRML